MKYRLCGVALLVALLSGCASTPNNGDSRSDPLEGFNRQMFNFNYYVLDPYVLRPVAVVWRCLLYTSPSPRDRQKSRMPSSA